MRIRGRWLGYAALAAAIAAATGWALWPRPVAVEVQAVERRTFEQTVEEEGKARVGDRYVVSAPVAGLLERPWLKVGDAVTQGAIVAVIRPAPPAIRDARAAAELRERIGAAEAGQARALAALEQARVALERASAEYERTRRLAAQGFVSASAEEQARLAQRAQAGSVRAAEAELEAARHELALARVSAREGLPSAGARQPRVEVRSEVAGTVLKVLQQSEAVVAQGMPLFELGDVRLLEVAVDLLTQEASLVAPGMTARLAAGPGLPTFEGRVRLVEPVARTKVSTLGVEEQRVTVLIDPIPEVPAVVGDGWRIDVSIVVMVQPAATVVPLGAIFRDGDGWAAFAVDGGVARRRPIEVGARNAREAWVRSGLEPGRGVVVYPPDSLRDGMRVVARR